MKKIIFTVFVLGMFSSCVSNSKGRSTASIVDKVETLNIERAPRRERIP